jgi:beta-lactamase superfamily II metal-dependent hydrolase
MMVRRQCCVIIVGVNRDGRASGGEMMFLNDAGGRCKLSLKDDAGKTVATLLWGDPLHELERSGERVKVRARKRIGWVPASAVGETGLLEIYVIDVGQGDGVLLRTPHDDAWHLIDAGIRARDQMTRKGAANFVRWKFIDDLRRDRVQLKSAIVSHPDADHYGGFVDLLSGALPDGRTFGIEVEHFWHSGLGRFRDAPVLGAQRADTSTTPLGQPGSGLKAATRFIVELIDGKTHFGRPKRPFATDFAELARLVGKVPKRVDSIAHTHGWLPGYAPAAGQAAIRVLAPVAETLAGGGKGLRDLGSDSVTRNGHSVVLRVDYGRARFLLTGDLNTASQKLLLGLHPAHEFSADVAKGCHHGSDDIDLRFVRAMAARATVISSGDNEDYAHPRPRILGASARYGREARAADGSVLPPLLYSTELARSVGLGFAAHVRTVAVPKQPYRPDQLEADFDPSPAGRYRRLSALPIATDLVYGLVNVRSDGNRILCATMKEGSSDFDLQVFDAGADPA